MKAFFITLLGIFLSFATKSQIETRYSKEPIFGPFGVFNVDTIRNFIDIYGIDINKALKEKEEPESEKDKGRW